MVPETCGGSSTGVGPRPERAVTPTYHSGEPQFPSLEATPPPDYPPSLRPSPPPLPLPLPLLLPLPPPPISPVGQLTRLPGHAGESGVARGPEPSLGPEMRILRTTRKRFCLPRMSRRIGQQMQGADKVGEPTGALLRCGLRP